MDHEWRSRDDAEDLVRQLERGTLDLGGAAPLSARTRELFGLIPVSLLVSAGFAAVLVTRTEDVSDATMTYGAVFLGLCVFAHLFIRARLPDADPYLFPLAGVLAAFGLVMIYRIDAELAREQAQWFVIGLIAFCATVTFLRDHHSLERYRYTIAAVGIGLLVLPRLPGIGAQVNGAFLAVKVGPDPVPAGGVRQDRDHRLPRELPARHGGRARAAAAAPAAVPEPAPALRWRGGLRAAGEGCAGPRDR